MGFDLFKRPINALGAFFIKRLPSLSVLFLKKHGLIQSQTERSPLFSVCIFSYNRANTLKRAIDSVLNQTCPEYELVVVNDGSTDETRELLKTLQKQFAVNQTAPVLKVVTHSHNKGRSAARNSAISVSSGVFLVWLADDDELMPTHLATYQNMIQTSPDLDILYCDLIGKFVEENGREERYCTRDYSGQPLVLFKDLIEGQSIVDGGSAVRATLYQLYGRYDERFRRAQDYHFWLKVALSANVKYVPQPLYVYYRHNQNSYFTERGDETYEVLALQECVYSIPLYTLFSKVNELSLFSVDELLILFARAFMKKQEWARASALFAQVETWTRWADEHLLSFWKASVLSGRFNDFEPTFLIIHQWSLTDNEVNPEVITQILSIHSGLKESFEMTKNNLKDRSSFFISLKKVRQCFGKLPWIGLVCLGDWADRTGKSKWAKVYYQLAWQLDPEDEISWSRLCSIAGAESDLAYLMERKSRRLAFPLEQKVKHRRVLHPSIQNNVQKILGW